MGTGKCKICGCDSDVYDEEKGICFHCWYKTKFIKDRWLNKKFKYIAIRVRKKWEYFKKIET